MKNSELERERLWWISKLHGDLEFYVDQTDFGDMYILTEEDRSRFILCISERIVAAFELEREGKTMIQMWTRMLKLTDQRATRWIKAKLLGTVEFVFAPFFEKLERKDKVK